MSKYNRPLEERVTHFGRYLVAAIKESHIEKGLYLPNSPEWEGERAYGDALKVVERVFLYAFHEEVAAAERLEKVCEECGSND